MTSIDIAQPEDEAGARRRRRLRLAAAEMSLSAATRTVTAARKEPGMLKLHYDVAANADPPHLSDRDLRMLRVMGRLERRLNRRTRRLEPTSASRIQYADTIEREIGGRR